MQRIGFFYHDNAPYDCDMPDDKIMFRRGIDGVIDLSIGHNATIFITRERLTELRDKISDFLALQEQADAEEAAEHAAELAQEDHEAGYEGMAERCPTRE